MTCGVIPVIFIICAGSLINHLDVINRSDSGGWRVEIPSLSCSSWLGGGWITRICDEAFMDFHPMALMLETVVGSSVNK